MGHNRKNANRAEAIKRNADRYRALDKRLGELERENRLARAELDQRILTLDHNLDILRRHFEDFSRPRLDKLRERIRNVIQKPRSSAPEPEVIDLDVSEDDSDGRELQGRADEGGEPEGATAFEEDDEDDQAEADDDQDVEEMAEELLREIEEAGEEISRAADRIEEQKRRLNDPLEILGRLESRLDSAKAEAADVFENQELDREERAQLLDELAERIDSLSERVKAQRIAAGLPREPAIPEPATSARLESAIDAAADRARINRRKHLAKTHGRE